MRDTYERSIVKIKPIMEDFTEDEWKKAMALNVLVYVVVIVISFTFGRKYRR